MVVPGSGHGHANGIVVVGALLGARLVCAEIEVRFRIASVAPQEALQQSGGAGCYGLRGFEDLALAFRVFVEAVLPVRTV